jgi:hypothetical protein
MGAEDNYSTGSVRLSNPDSGYGCVAGTCRLPGDMKNHVLSVALLIRLMA